MPDKKRERYYMNQFLKTQPQLASMKCVRAKPPAADFILNHPRGPLGLEVTEFHLDAGANAHTKSIIDLVVNKASRLHCELGGPPLLVSVLFEDTFRLNKAHTSTFAKEMAEAIRRVSPPKTLKDGLVFVPPSYLPQGIASISLQAGYGEETWVTHFVAMVATIRVEDVQKTIDHKATKYVGYAKSCRHTWLVMVLDWSRGQPAKIPSEVLSAEYSAPFERLFWLFSQNCPSARELQKKSLIA